MKSLTTLMGIAVLVALGTGLVLNDANAQNVDKSKIQQFLQKGKGGTTTTPAATADLLTAPLFPPDTVAKLKLTAEQKKEYDALVKEFDEQLKKLAAAPAANTTTTPAKGKVFGKGKGTATPATPAAMAITLRAEYEEKVEKMLT